ncbi:hypothetical protein FIBSPDRAFT_300168 [Athelia psychrophila]|uniref:Uncharacterized protein n=1 Tax=Athelia psychrophila TaxID=1759441 RepID=A0A166QVZ9_9AGAM|nr:hypothetical protein FIBSPDRAFT_300168 [Fibularhizoctonia sp. CBS 109695]
MVQWLRRKLTRRRGSWSVVWCCVYGASFMPLMPTGGVNDVTRSCVLYSTALLKTISSGRALLFSWRAALAHAMLQEVYDLNGQDERFSTLNARNMTSNPPARYLNLRSRIREI